MRFFNVEVTVPDCAQYITVDADGEISAWSERPEHDHICWYAADSDSYLGHTADTEEWNTHWYVKLDDEWWYEEIGRKDDAAKLRYDLLPPYALEQLTAVLTYGAAKYGANNWQHVSFAEDRYYAAALRHLQAWRKGERIDPESGLPHLAHAMCSLVFLLEQAGPNRDGLFVEEQSDD